ncbi:MAG: radical SAM protein [Bdellovibrio sp.]|nr:radical SAM protein [Bdellovibrio sp.]
MLDEKTLKKLLLNFHGPGGRYAYFPFRHDWSITFDGSNPRDSWSTLFSENMRLPDGQSTSSPLTIDLYLHLPFCEQLCTFCGCNIAVTKDHQVERPYIETILRELDYYRERLGPLTVNSIYFGGGTPNFLSPENLQFLLQGIFSKIATSETFFGTIEIDPRHLNPEFVAVLAQYKIKRFILGVQDLDPQTMANVNRPQNLSVLEKSIETIARIENYFLSADLIYGLPLQTQDRVMHTITELSRLPLHAVSLYPLAQAFWQKQHQVAFGQFSTYSPETMVQLFLRGDSVLKEHDFQSVGFGHYFRTAHADSKIILEGRGARNVSGLSPRLTPYLLGLGVGAISTFPNLYWQNQRVLEQYKRQIGGTDGHPERAHLRTDVQRFFGTFFEKLICQKVASNALIDEAESKYTLPEKNLHLELLAQLHVHQILTPTEDGIQVSELGTYFMKSICQAFDPYFLGRK